MSHSKVPQQYRAFWQRFETALGKQADERFYCASHFDDNQPSADALAALVLAGKKCATAGLVWDLENDGEVGPTVGDLSIVTNWAGVPLCVIETRAVLVLPFDQVDADFAAAEGEGDGSLAHWREVHAAYFDRACARIGRTPSADMPVLCERFELIYCEAPQDGA
jgi:uncharacterized protein YhfF